MIGMRTSSIYGRQLEPELLAYYGHPATIHPPTNCFTILTCNPQRNAIPNTQAQGGSIIEVLYALQKPQPGYQDG